MSLHFAMSPKYDFTPRVVNISGDEEHLRWLANHIEVALENGSSTLTLAKPDEGGRVQAVIIIQKETP